MHIPLSWLKEYFDKLPSVDTIVNSLTNIGLEVDAVVTVTPKFEGIRIAKVLEISPHPNADKLIVAKVTTGDDIVELVCGAQNCRPGLVTALAPIGSCIENIDGKKFIIKKTKLRGVESNGMLCSGKELGISEDDDGIIELSHDQQIGKDFASEYNETVLEISITPNLGHCLSIRGIARELSAACNLSLIEKRFSNPKESLESPLKVMINDFDACPRYACQLFDNVQIAPSPSWLSQRLKHAEIRPINNVVDIMNYVMLELGQPLHAFDSKKILQNTIVVDKASSQLEFISLDNQKREIQKDTLLIKDSNKPIALAGIMGGRNSEVDENTLSILVESAIFNAKDIRKSSKNLKLYTEASKRFERKIDPNGVTTALNYASELIKKVCPNAKPHNIQDIKKGDFLKKQVTCRFSRINSLLGTQLSVSEIEAVLKRLNMTPLFDGDDLFSISIPTYRNDISEEVDIIEEVARIYGYDNIEKKTLYYAPSSISHIPIYLFEKRVQNLMLQLGLQELITCDLISPKHLDIMLDSDSERSSYIKVLNPNSVEHSILRTSLLPNHLDLIKRNIDHNEKDLQGFEIGRVHFKKNNGFVEKTMLSIALTGKRSTAFWSNKSKDLDFFDLKGILESFLLSLNIEKVLFQASEEALFHPGRQSAISINGINLGFLGQLHPRICRKMDIDQNIFFSEICLHELFQHQSITKKIEDLPSYPGSDRDWTITCDEDVLIEEILNAFRTTKSNLLKSVTLLDLYRGGSLGKGKKNATFRLVYRDNKKTVSFNSVEAEHDRLKKNVKEKLKNRIVF